MGAGGRLVSVSGPGLCLEAPSKVRRTRGVGPSPQERRHLPGWCRGLGVSDNDKVRGSTIVINSRDLDRDYRKYDKDDSTRNNSNDPFCVPIPVCQPCKCSRRREILLVMKGTPLRSPASVFVKFRYRIAKTLPVSLKLQTALHALHPAAVGRTQSTV